MKFFCLCWESNEINKETIGDNTELHVDEYSVFMYVFMYLTGSISYGMCDLEGFMEFKMKWSEVSEC
jgi:hypothetical protein